MNMKKMLITGVTSGMGKYLHEHLGGEGLTRKNAEKIFSEHKRFDAIIHCAYNSKREVNSENLYSYVCDNIALTEKLLDLPHKMFIFFSTVDVYPRAKGLHKEDEVIRLSDVTGMYAITKLISESLVTNKGLPFMMSKNGPLRSVEPNIMEERTMQ